MADAEQSSEKIAKVIKISDTITVGDLAKKLDIPVTSLITELMKNGLMATVNEKLDFDTVEIVLGEMEGDFELEKEAKKSAVVEREKRELSDKAEDRPPVVAVMGHVDHGKTSLLDAIRDADEASNEAGGITQHISAYQIMHSDRPITFLDTPGHEAFAAIREHSARLTDVAIIVIAADDGIKPQTEEAIRFAKQAGVKMIIAINKMDKEGANPNLVKQQLADKGLLLEEWGGDTIAVEVSAKNKQGVDKLLDMVFLVADVEELKADVECEAEGLIIEAHMEKGRGPVATALVEHGTLKKGDSIWAGSTYAKVKTLEGSHGENINDAGPSTPVIITGFKTLPRFGDVFKAVNNEKSARQESEKYAKSFGNEEKMNVTSHDLINMINKKRDTSELEVVFKADVQGSLKSVIDSVATLEVEEIKVRVIGSGVGNINENDVIMAGTSNAIVYGFNVEVPVNVKQLAQRENVNIKVFNIIYELIDDIKSEMETLLAPEIVETEIGKLIIKGVFRITKNEIICGGEVTKGKAKPATLVRVLRDGESIGEAEVKSVQRQQQEAKEILEGEMCGIQLSTDSKINLKEGDRLEFFQRETVARKL